MDRDQLASMIAEGLSQSEIGRRVGRNQSTVAYWVRKHGLTPRDMGQDQRGALPRELYAELIAQDLTVRQIAEVVDRSPTTVAYWMRRYGLRTTPAARQHAARTVTPRERFEARCTRHGVTSFVKEGDGTTSCLRCRTDAVSEWRRRTKRRLVERAGGACELCGYDRCVAALQFHHRDPQAKEFALGSRGLSRSWAVLTAEADKCALLCANCHAEVEAGAATLP